jgi:GNAT superfamily N-acetyltransferase
MGTMTAPLEEQEGPHADTPALRPGRLGSTDGGATGIVEPRADVYYMVTVRHATVEDATAIGRISVRVWQRAYRGQMPDEYLDSLRPEGRAPYWRRILSQPHDEVLVIVAEQAGAIIGFASIGPADGPEATGELYVINVSPDHWGTGAGRALLEAAEQELTRLGYAEAILWVLPGNARARRFYEVAGWTADGSERTAEVLGVVVPELRYRRQLGP